VRRFSVPIVLIVLFVMIAITHCWGLAVAAPPDRRVTR